MGHHSERWPLSQGVALKVLGDKDEWGPCRQAIPHLRQCLEDRLVHMVARPSTASATISCISCQSDASQTNGMMLVVVRWRPHPLLPWVNRWVTRWSCDGYSATLQDATLTLWHASTLRPLCAAALGIVAYRIRSSRDSSPPTLKCPVCKRRLEVAFHADGTSFSLGSKEGGHPSRSWYHQGRTPPWWRERVTDQWLE